MEKLLNFGQMLEDLKNGHKAKRAGWNGKDMYICLQRTDAQSKMQQDYIYIAPVCNGFIPWVASQADILANDWIVIDKIKEPILPNNKANMEDVLLTALSNQYQVDGGFIKDFVKILKRVL